MSAYEMLLSESQERMLIVAHAGPSASDGHFRKWDLDAVVIGRVRTVANAGAHNGETVADIPSQRDR